MSGRCSHPRWLNGHSSTNTLPTTRSTGTKRVGLVAARGPAQVVGRVRRVVAVVSHHEDVTLGHRAGGPAAPLHRAPAAAAALAGIALLVQRDAVDRDPSVGVAAVDGVPGDADDPLHQVAARGVQPDLRQDPGDRAGRPGGLLGRQPAARVLEHHHVAPLRGATEPVGHLLHQDPVVAHQPGLHRLRGDVERLEQQRLDEDRQAEGADEQDEGLEPERSSLPLVVVRALHRAARAQGGHAESLDRGP